MKTWGKTWGLAHIISTLTRQLEWPPLIIYYVNFPPTLIGHSSVVAALRQFENPVIWNVGCPCFC